MDVKKAGYVAELDEPSPLPVGLTEFHEWADDIIEKAGAFADSDSMKFALSSQIVHLPHDKAYVPKRFFIDCLRKAAANQVASQVFLDIKEKQKAASAASQPTAEATPVTESVAPDGQKQATKKLDS